LALKSQTLDSALYKNYPFIKLHKNVLSNDSVSLDAFYEKLYQLQQKTTSRVNIVHIGDSHIQADGLSGIVRQKLQLKFGNAGRGFIFPYRLAKSNEPTSYKTTTNKVWDYKRNVFYDKPLPIGVGGYTIETADSMAEVNLLVKDQPGLGYAFTKFTLFHDKNPENYDITICDDLNCERGVFKSTQVNVNPFVSEIIFDKPIKQLILKNKCSDTICQKSTRIYGMMVENDSLGLLYNMIGVNGAEYRHYVLSKYFQEQLTYLHPQLVILSLGTNEAFAGNFDKNVFYKSIDSLVVSIKQKNPETTFILCTPSDSYKRSSKGRVKNPFVKQAQETIIQYAADHNMAYWDLLEVMGGWGSMQQWYLKQLTAKDKVHFTSKGYQIQGDLLYSAIINGYENYLKSKK
jgi:hypothetical protein